MHLDGGILLGALFGLIFVSAILQSLSGFGFALLSAPLLADRRGRGGGLDGHHHRHGL